MKNNKSFEKYLEGEIRKDPNLKTKLEKISSAMDIAYQIYDLRRKKGLTQTQFARMIGISQPNVARIEKADYRNYTIKTLERAAQALNVIVNISFHPIPTITGSWIVSPSLINQLNSPINSLFDAKPYKAIAKFAYSYTNL